MQSPNDDKRKEVWGEVLMDELKVIHEYVRVIPAIQDKLQQLYAKVDKIDNRLKEF